MTLLGLRSYSGVSGKLDYVYLAPGSLAWVTGSHYDSFSFLVYKLDPVTWKTGQIGWKKADDFS